MTVEIDLERERLNLEIERLKFERQKFSVETLLRKREDQPKKTNTFRDIVSNPIVLAVVGGFVTLMTSIGSSAYTAWQNREADAARAELAREGVRDSLQADLIKKFVEGPSREVVRDNLKFLVDAGLLPTYASRIKDYLNANPGSAPQVSYSGGILGQDDAVLLGSLSPSDPLHALGRGVGYLMINDRQGMTATCTAFLVKTDIIATAGHCASSDMIGLSFVVNGKAIDAKVISSRMADREGASFSLLRLAETSTIPPLKLATKEPTLGEQLAIVMFRGTSSKLAVRSPDCRVSAVGAERLEHGCDTGSGSSGAPIFSQITGEVVALHSGRVASGGWGTIASVIAASMTALR